MWIINREESVGTRVFESNATLSPSGYPAALKVQTPENPFTEVNLTLNSAESPGVTDLLRGLTSIAKSGTFVSGFVDFDFVQQQTAKINKKPIRMMKREFLIFTRFSEGNGTESGSKSSGAIGARDAVTGKGLRGRNIVIPLHAGNCHLDRLLFLSPFRNPVPTIHRLCWVGTDWDPFS